MTTRKEFLEYITKMSFIELSDFGDSLKSSIEDCMIGSDHDCFEDLPSYSVSQCIVVCATSELEELKEGDKVNE